MDLGGILTIVGVLLACLAGVLMTVVRLPGTWLIVAVAVGVGWWSDWQRVALWLIAILITVAVVGEVLELLSSVLMARRAGASRQAAWGGLIGGIVGMFLLSFLVPIPVIGTMVGALLGCFLGATLAELSVRGQLGQGTRVGFFSALGFVLGTVTKMAIALVMSGLLLTSAVCSGSTALPPDEETLLQALPAEEIVEDGS